MKKKLLFSGVAMMLLFTNCNNDLSSNDDENHKEESKEHVENRDSDQKDDEGTLSLNAGEKWKVNPEMLPHIQKSEKVFKNFEGNNYTKLSEDLMTPTNELIQSCTMGGKSHDELHKWLHPHIKLIKSLSEVENDEEGKEKYYELNESFETFHKYFE